MSDLASLRAQRHDLYHFIVRRTRDPAADAGAAAIIGPPGECVEAIERCRAELARYKQPKEIHLIAFEDFPRSASGKIQRHELEKRTKP